MTTRTFAPIVLFCFNRPDLLERTLQALAANTGACESHLTIFCDGPRHAEEKKLTDATRTVARSAYGFASLTLIEREQNMGCAASIIDGLQHMFAKHERLIIMEDDILTSPHTLEYLNEGLSRYEEALEIFSISSFTYPANEMPIPQNYQYDVYIAPRFNCWGWASWRDRFEQIDWEVSDYATIIKDPQFQQKFSLGGAGLPNMLKSQMLGTINTWDIQVEYTRFKLKKNCIQPSISYSTNTGTHCGTHAGTFSHEHFNDITLAKPIQNFCWLDDLTLNPEIQKTYYRASSSEFLSFKHRLIRILRPPLHYLGIWQILKKLFANIKR